MSITMPYPLPCTYAVIQVDFEATIRNIDEPQIVEATRKLSDKKCLILLHSIERGLAPDDQSYVFDSLLVGPGVRPLEKGVTADMCIPIFPASAHPTGRAPVHSEPSFPFSNCYHWFGPGMQLDIRIKGGIFSRGPDTTPSTLLPIRQAMVVEDTCSDDMDRCCELLEQLKDKRVMPPNKGDTEMRIGGSSVPGFPANHWTSVVPPGQIPQVGAWDRSSVCSDNTVRTRWSAIAEVNYDDLEFMEISDNRASCFPICDVQIDIAEALKDDEIPDPIEFAEQYESLYDMLKQYKEAEWNKRKMERQLAEQEAASVYSAKEADYDLYASSHSPTHRTSKVRKLAHMLVRGARSLLCLGGSKYEH